MSGICILNLFFPNSNWFLQCQHFFTTRCYLFYMSSVGKMNISLTILVAFRSRKFRNKLLLTFLITHFQYRRVLSTYFIIYQKFDLFIGILNFNERAETWWRHQKSYVTLITILVFFERSYVVPHSCKVS